MKSFLLLLLLIPNVFAADDTYVGWVSDSGCARARASSGRFSATNPDCARRCVKEGKDIVLISQERKTVFSIQNPEMLKDQVGNKVGLSATSVGPHSIRVNKITFTEKSDPQCERPRLKD
jgi:hypothetical protein